MGAARFVGRVGGLAVALGVGAAVASGAGVAWADAGTDAGSGGKTPNAARAADSTHVKRGATGRAAAGPSAATRNARPAAAARAAVRNAPPVSVSGAAPTVKLAAPQFDTAPAATGGQARSAVAPAAEVDNEVDNQSDPVVVTPLEQPAPESAPAPEVTGFLTDAGDGESDGAGGDPNAPVENPLSLVLLEVSRRTGSAASSNATAAVVANSQATVTQGSLTVTPTVEFVNGFLAGAMGAASSTGQSLSFSFVGSSAGGKLTLGNKPAPTQQDPSAKDPQSFTALPYGNWINPDDPDPLVLPSGTQTFSVRVSEVTDFDKFLTGIPLLGILASPIINLLQQAPLISGLLAPIIGNSVVATIETDLDELVPYGENVAFTYKVTSFDGTPISTNFFPALPDSKGQGNVAYTLLNGPGLGSAGVTDPYGITQAAGSTPGLPTLRGQGVPGSGFNVITWDPRGEFASGGILQLDNPFFEGRDVSAIIDWATANTPAVLEAPGDIAVGMIGGSYGGGIQMTTVDPRIDAIVPTIAWNSLNDALYPTDVFKTGWANTLFFSLLTSGARVNDQIPLGILTGDLFGFLSETAQAVLASSGPTALLTKLDIPSLFVQGTVDALFPLAQAVTNIQTLLEQNPYFTGANASQAKMIWYCGGHGLCLDPTDLAAQAQSVFGQDMLWLNKYVKGAPIPDVAIPTFQWWDQAGSRYTSSLLPFQPGFTSGGITQDGADGILGIAPFAFMGSGPYNGSCAGNKAAACSFPLNQVFATPTNNSLKINFAPAAGTQIVGAPTVSFTYSGLGTSKAVYAQIVDNDSGRVLGNIVTPIPVILDGRERQASVSIADIAYTAPAGTAGSLTLQIVPSASLYWNSSFGVINVSDLTATLPTTTAGTKV